MGGGSQPIVNNGSWTLGWGQLNDQANVHLPISFGNLQLDIVGFLAILGEGAVTATSQVATLSRMIYLPRLLPAPQALLRPSRNENLEPVPGQATGVESGNVRQYINYIGHILAGAESLPDYTVKCVSIKRIKNEGEVKAKVFGPTGCVALLGCFCSMALFAVALEQGDGMAMLAVISLSFLSTLVGIANKWKLNLPKRRGGSNWTPPGDVVLKYPKGSFVVVRCSEDVARELYFAPEGIEYDVSHPWKYRMIALAGTILLMFSVIFLGNAGTVSQVAFAGAYMILNAAFWIIAALPPKLHWNLDAFEVEPQGFDDGSEPLTEADTNGHGRRHSIMPKRAPKGSLPYVSYNDTFTQALWKVIIATRDIHWIKLSGAAPKTEAWDRWLQEALERAKDAPKPETKQDEKYKSIQYYNVPEWDAQKELGSIINELKQGDMEKALKKTASDKIAPGLEKGTLSSCEAV